MSAAYETIVIGGGISGLSFVHALGDGADVCLLERSRRAGGLVHTVQVEEPWPLRYEDGPEALTTSEDIVELASELGLTLVESGAKQRFLVHRGEIVSVPMSPPALIGTRLLSLRGKLRLLTEPWRRTRAGLDGSVAEFVRHRLGEEALEALIDPLVSGIHAGNPEELSARACFPRLVRMVEEHGSLFGGLRAGRRQRTDRAPGLSKPTGGMQGLTDALARSLGERVRLGVEVRGLHAERDAWVVTTSGGPMKAKQVVLALPLGATRRLLAVAAPGSAHFLAEMRSESIVSVLHAYPRAAVTHPLDGFGYLVPRREARRHLGTLFSSSIDPACCMTGHVLLRTLLGGARRQNLVDEADDKLEEIVRSEVRPLLGIGQDPVWSRVARYRHALPRFDLAHPLNLAGFEEALPRGLRVLGNFTRGIGLASLVAEARRAASSHGRGAGSPKGRPWGPPPGGAKALPVPASHRAGLHEVQRLELLREHPRSHGDQP